MVDTRKLIQDSVELTLVDLPIADMESQRQAGEGNAYLVTATDKDSVAAARFVGSRIASGKLGAIDGRWRALELGTAGFAGIPNSPLDQAERQPLQAAQTVWGVVAASGQTGDLVIQVVRTVSNREDFAALCDHINRVHEIFQQDELPVRLVAIAACLRPVNRIDSQVLCSAPGLALPPILLTLCPPGGPVPQSLVPSAIAEFLELLAGGGLLMFGSFQPGPHKRAFVVALDAIEVPNDAEERYLALHLTETWLDDILRLEPAARKHKTTPSTAVSKSVERILAQVKADEHSLAREMKVYLRSAERELEFLVCPSMLHRLALADQLDAISAANDRITEPMNGLLQRLRSSLSSVLQSKCETSAKAWTETYRFIGGFDGGVSLAEEMLSKAAGQLEKLQRQRAVGLIGDSEARVESSLGIDTAEFRERAPKPRCAPLRTFLPWLALLAVGTAFISVSQSPIATIHPSLDHAFGSEAGGASRAVLQAGVVVGVAILWQAVQFARARWSRRRAAHLPIRRYRQRLFAWKAWFERFRLLQLVRQNIDEVLTQVRALRLRLTEAQGHLQMEASAELTRLLGPSFPRREGRSRKQMDTISRKLREDYGLTWAIERLKQSWGIGDDFEAFGRNLFGLLHSEVITPGCVDDGDSLVGSLARAAVKECLDNEEQLETLDSRIANPGYAISNMCARSIPVGNRVLHSWYFGNRSSKLAEAAANECCFIVDRLDRSRAAIVGVGIRTL